jgi:hypothetical protein
MNKIRGLNVWLIAVIILLISVIISFNYGYSLGERRGYVLGVQRCLEQMKDNNRQTQFSL